MNKERWLEITLFRDNGDPLKDIDCDETELLDYIDELRKRLNLKDDQP